jgi:hypothetical protein
MTVLVAIRGRSSQKWVSLDARNFTQFAGDGGGSAALQPHVRGWEIFRLRELGNGTVAFEATAFPNVYLRLDGQNVQPGQAHGGGAGKVNAQIGIGHYEQFTIKRKPDTGNLGIESKQFPGRFLRASGNTVNAQGVWGGDEEFEVQVLGVE